MTTSTTQDRTLHDGKILYLLSNFAVGSTDKGDYWQEQIAMLQRDALPWQAYEVEPTPAVILDTTTQPNIAALLTSDHVSVEIWPTWCTFITTDRRTSESFLIVNVTYPTIATPDSMERIWQRQQLMLHFPHQQCLQLLEAIEDAGKLVLRTPAHPAGLTIPFYDPELTLHLEYIRPLYR